MSTTLVTSAAALSAASAIKQGQIAEAQGRFQEKIAERNAAALRRQAKARQEASFIEEQRLSKRQKLIQSAQRAAIGKSGVSIAGSTLSVLADTAYQFALDRNLILRQGLFDAQSFSEAAQLELARGKWAKTLGLQAKRASYIKAGSSILGSIGKNNLFSSGTTTTTTTSATTSNIRSGYFTSPVYSGRAWA